jgi:hypothetical protein
MRKKGTWAQHIPCLITFAWLECSTLPSAIAGVGYVTVILGWQFTQKCKRRRKEYIASDYQNIKRNCTGMKFYLSMATSSLVVDPPQQSEQGLVA